MISQHRCCCLPITSCNPNNFCVSISTCKLYFRYHSNTSFFNFHNQRHCIRNTRTFYHLSCIQNLTLCMLSIFPFNINTFKNTFVPVFYFSSIRNKYFKPFFLCQQCSSNSTFSSTEDYNSIFTAFSHLPLILILMLQTLVSPT